MEKQVLKFPTLCPTALCKTSIPSVNYSKYTCDLCCGILLEPYTIINCNHSFCRICFTKFKSNERKDSNVTDKCPKCNQQFTSCSPNKELDKELSEIQVLCTFCSKTFPPLLWFTHFQEEAQKKCPCPLECGKEHSAKELINALNNESHILLLYKRLIMIQKTIENLKLKTSQPK